MTPTVLLLHGFTHTGSSWEPVVAALGERYRSITPDLRGHGAAWNQEPVTLGAVLGDLEVLAQPGPVTLVGYSMGGRIALHCALAWPRTLERLILISASPGIADPADRGQRRRADERLADEIDRLSIDAFVERWAETPVLMDVPSEVRARAQADRRRNRPVGLARALRGLGAGALPPVWGRLGELAVPVTLVVGERDAKFTGIAESMHGAIADAEVLVVLGVGHAVHLEAPERVAEIIAS